MSEDQRCQCTVINNSKYDLINVEYQAEHGKWANPDEHPTNPPSNIPAGKDGWWMLTGAEATATGAEGFVKYQVAQVGVIQFSFANPWGTDDNYAKCDNNSALKYSVYAASDKPTVGEKGPDIDKKHYGKEGRVPPTGSPLSVLWILGDQSQEDQIQ